jgi:hypothetical protein
MNKANANHNTILEIKLVLWLIPLFPPKRCALKFIVVKAVTSNGGKGDF